MMGIDTNVLVRFLLGDDIKQANRVYKLFKKAEQEKTEFFVPSLVVLELIWVLESAYEIDRSHIIDSIGQLILMPIFQFENLPAIQKFVAEAQQSKFDLSDLLMAQTAKAKGCKTVFTFDKKASEYKLFDLL